MSNKSNVFIGEGPSEQIVIEVLGVAGKFMKMNIWDIDISTRLRTIPNDADVYLMLDADHHDDVGMLKKMTSNVSKLLARKGKTFVLLQVTGLEDELILAFGDKFNEAFEGVNKKGLKKIILDKCSNELKSKMRDYGFDRHKMWVTEADVSYDFLNELRRNFSNLKTYRTDQ